MIIAVNHSPTDRNNKQSVDDVVIPGKKSTCFRYKEADGKR